jgi:hypothetical protein
MNASWFLSIQVSGLRPELLRAQQNSKVMVQSLSALNDVHALRRRNDELGTIFASDKE